MRRYSRMRCVVLALLTGGLSFLLLQLALGMAIEQCLPGVRDPEYDCKIERLRACLAEAPERPLILVLGSSRVQMGLDAAQVQTSFAGQPALVFNFGMSGGGALLESVCLRRLLEAGIRPDLLVLEVLPLTLNQPGDHPLEEEWLTAGRLRSGEVASLERYHSNPDRPLRQWIKCRACPCLWQQNDLRSNLALDTCDPEQRPERIQGRMDGHGWLPYCKEDVSKERREALIAYARQQYVTALGEFRLAPGPSRALEEIVARCHQLAIPTILLLMPEGPSFRSLYTPSALAGVEQHIMHLAQQRNLPLVDVRYGMRETDFWDGHHLLPRGATTFTRRFQAELASLLPRGSRTE